MVAPKRAALAEANKRLEGANKKLGGIRARVKELQDRVAALEDSLMKATEDKNNAVAQARAGRWGLRGGAGDPAGHPQPALLLPPRSFRHSLHPVFLHPTLAPLPACARRSAPPTRPPWRSA